MPPSRQYAKSINVVVPPWSAARPTCSGPAVVSVVPSGSDAGVVHVDVRVDAAGHHDAIPGVDHTRRKVDRQRADSRDRSNGFAGHRDVGADHASRRHDIAALNDEIEHRASGGGARLVRAILQVYGDDTSALSASP